jgi:16S rRNA (guanine1516-N2)-methyltransferase
LTVPERLGSLRLEIDLEGGPLAQRLRTASRRQPLPRAVGLHKRTGTVVDATAGTGRDALVLAWLGARVTAVERIPVLAAMLWDAVRHSPLAGRLDVRVGESAAYLQGLGERPDVVCLDPMFAEAGNAQVKKDTQVLRLLSGPPDDIPALFQAAMAAARERVVVKRHPDHAPIGGTPSFTVAAARVRFDVYLKGQ